MGKALADKVIEMVEGGSIRKVQEVCSTEQAKVLSLFSGVWGAGPATAQAWWARGRRRLEDLQEETLTRQLEVGLRLYEDLNTRMPRAEAGELAALVQEEAELVRPGVEVTACGSYRRGLDTCGDLDVLLSHPEEEDQELLGPLLARLRRRGVLTDDLALASEGSQRKYMGVGRLPGKEGSLHRRVDIIAVPWQERGAALLYFTGSAEFNRGMRAEAVRQGGSLSEHGLRRGVVRGAGGKAGGQLLPANTEEEVFVQLGLEYRAPEERRDWTVVKTS